MISTQRKEIIFSSTEPDKNNLWGIYEDGGWSIKVYGSNGWEPISGDLYYQYVESGGDDTKVGFVEKLVGLDNLVATPKYQTQVWDIKEDSITNIGNIMKYLVSGSNSTQLKQDFLYSIYRNGPLMDGLGYAIGMNAPLQSALMSSTEFGSGMAVNSGFIGKATQPSSTFVSYLIDNSLNSGLPADSSFKRALCKELFSYSYFTSAIVQTGMVKDWLLSSGMIAELKAALGLTTGA